MPKARHTAGREPENGGRGAAESEDRSGPVSRVLFPPALASRRADDHFSRTAVARGLQQPTRKVRRDGPPRVARWRTNSFLLGLAPGGVYRARPVTRPAGELLPHRFTLTAGVAPGGGLLSVALSLASRPVGVTHHPRPAEPGLSSRRGLSPTTGGRPVRSSHCFLSVRSRRHEWPASRPNGPPTADLTAPKSLRTLAFMRFG